MSPRKLKIRELASKQQYDDHGEGRSEDSGSSLNHTMQSNARPECSLIGKKINGKNYFWRNDEFSQEKSNVRDTAHKNEGVLKKNLFK